LIEKSIGRSHAGRQEVQNLVEAIRSVTDSAGKAQSLIHQVQAGNQEQAGEIARISQALAAVERGTTAAAANAEQAAATGETLREQSGSLNSVVRGLIALTSSRLEDR
jgi:methyl-accepting chemotaxis protein